LGKEKKKKREKKRRRRSMMMRRSYCQRRCLASCLLLLLLLLLLLTPFPTYYRAKAFGWIAPDVIPGVYLSLPPVLPLLDVLVTTRW